MTLAAGFVSHDQWMFGDRVAWGPSRANVAVCSPINPNLLACSTGDGQGVAATVLVTVLLLPGAIVAGYALTMPAIAISGATRILSNMVVYD